MLDSLSCALLQAQHPLLFDNTLLGSILELLDFLTIRSFLAVFDCINLGLLQYCIETLSSLVHAFLSSEFLVLLSSIYPVANLFDILAMSRVSLRLNILEPGFKGRRALFDFTFFSLGLGIIKLFFFCLTELYLKIRL